jgi:ubiquinone/menaquinone biosynthesis C-methylase UbiE
MSACVPVACMHFAKREILSIAIKRDAAGCLFDERSILRVSLRAYPIGYWRRSTAERRQCLRRGRRTRCRARKGTTAMDAKTHWEHIYATKAPTQVSWYQQHPHCSMRLILGTGIRATDPIIDVGGGASTLVDDLLTAGFQSVTVLDISATALQLARQRLEAHADVITWIEADIRQTALPDRSYALWHDRAVFHFLTHMADRQHYVDTLRRTIRPGGHVIVATFAPDGPQQCSGLDVQRYAPESLHRQFGPGFELVESMSESHQTPWGTEQKFIYCYCRRSC